MAGIVDACRGRRFDVWAMPALSRGQQAGAVHGPVLE